MRKETHYAKIKELPSGVHVKIDFRFVKEGGTVTDFAINLSLLEEHGEVCKNVYRVDTRHGFLHEQRFWISPKPIRLERQSYRDALEEKGMEVMENYARWAGLFMEAMPKKGGERRRLDG